MGLLGSYIRQRPRATAAVAFGSATTIVTHLAWVPDARMNGLTPALTIAAGAAHALAGAMIGRRLLDGNRTPLQAGLLGAVTSLLAVALFTPAFVILLLARDVRPSGVLSYLLLAVLTSLFSFLAHGWALLLVSVGVGWTLYRVAAPEKNTR